MRSKWSFSHRFRRSEPGQDFWHRLSSSGQNELLGFGVWSTLLGASPAIFGFATEVLTMKKIRLDSPFLESYELFAGVSSAIQSEVLASGTTRRFERREALFFTGDTVGMVMLLLQGCVKLTQLTERGSEVILRLHGPGEIIGVPDWTPGDVHSSTAQALQASVALVWSPETFQSLLQRFPQLQRNAIEIIQHMLRALERRYCVVSTATVAPRLAHGLVHVFEQVGQEVNGHVEINLTQEELGQMTAMSSFEVSRVLSQWERQGLVKLRREVIEVQNLHRLLELCEVN